MKEYKKNTMQHKNLPLLIASIFVLFVKINLTAKQLTLYTEGDTLFSYAINGLKLRTEPNMDADVLELIEYGQKVQVIDTSENFKNNEFTIDGFKGKWVYVKYKEKVGFAFDGFLSKLPNVPLSKENFEFKSLGENEIEDPYEGHQMEKELANYIGQNFKPTCETVEYYDAKAGKGILLEITKLQQGFTKIKRNGWEGYTLELVVNDTRLSEIKHLILFIARKAKVYENTFKEINDGLQNINEHKYFQSILNLPMFRINIKNYDDNNTWAIEFEVTVA